MASARYPSHLISCVQPAPVGNVVADTASIGRGFVIVPNGSIFVSVSRNEESVKERWIDRTRTTAAGA
jgi:hypothetical protein